MRPALLLAALLLLAAPDLARAAEPSLVARPQWQKP